MPAASSCASIRRWCRRERLIANVEGAMNAVMVQGDAVGTTLYYGKGAGAEPTASAVIADLVDIARLATADPDHRVPHLAFQPAAMQDLACCRSTTSSPRSTCACRSPTRPACWRASPASSPSTASRSTRCCSGRAPPARGEARTDVIILTHDTVEGRMTAAIAKMQALPTVLAKIVRIRKEDLA